MNPHLDPPGRSPEDDGATTGEAVHAGEAGPPPPTWHPLTRIAFRFVFLHFVLYILPFPLGQIPGTGFIAGWWSSLWTRAAQLVGPSLGLEIVLQPTGSGDTAYQYALLFCKAVVAALGTVVWSVLDRHRTSYEQLHGYFRVYGRYWLASVMISYGAFKVIKTQFPYPSLVRLLEPLGNGSPMGLLWKFMGYSPAMNVFTGLGEFVGGFLLFFRRTTTLGGLLLIAVLSNVVVMNYAYDVPVKLYSSHLLAMAFLLVLPDAKRLADVIVLNRPTGSRPLGALLPEGRVRAAGYVAKALFIGFVCWSNLSTSYRFERQRVDRGPLHGIYDVERFVLGGDTLPPLITDSIRWRRMIVEYGGVTVQTMTGPLQGDDALRYNLRADTSAGHFEMRSRADSTDVPGAFDYVVDGAVIEARGLWRDDSLAVRLRRFDESTFLLSSRGYHWVSELPFNR